MPGNILDISATYPEIAQHAIVKGDQCAGAASSATGALNAAEAAGDMLEQPRCGLHDFLPSMRLFNSAAMGIVRPKALEAAHSAGAVTTLFHFGKGGLRLKPGFCSR